MYGEAPEIVYQEVARGRVLTLSGLQFWVDAAVLKHARKAGVRIVEFLERRYGARAGK